MRNTLIELQHLSSWHPGAAAGDAEVMAWYRAKSELHEHLAAETRDPAAAARQRDLSMRCRRRAAEMARQLSARPNPLRRRVAVAGIA